jgi:hypothetical protein
MVVQSTVQIPGAARFTVDWSQDMAVITDPVAVVTPTSCVTSSTMHSCVVQLTEVTLGVGIAGWVRSPAADEVAAAAAAEDGGGEDELAVPQPVITMAAKIPATSAMRVFIRVPPQFPGQVQ